MVTILVIMVMVTDLDDRDDVNAVVDDGDDDDAADVDDNADDDDYLLSRIYRGVTRHYCGHNLAH